MDGRVRTAQITIVEDNPGDVLLVRKALEEKGIIFALTCFENGEDALNHLSRQASNGCFSRIDKCMLTCLAVSCLVRPRQLMRLSTRQNFSPRRFNRLRPDLSHLQ